MTVEIGYVDIAPSKEGQINIFELFVSQVLADIKVGRKGADREILSSIVDIAFTLGHNEPRPSALKLRQRLEKIVDEAFV